MIMFKSTGTISGQKITVNSAIKLLSMTLIFAVSVSYMLKAFTNVYYHEIDSYILPAISAQYRHTFIITQEDIDRAKIDFPDYYEDVDDFDSLRSSKLSKITDDKWVAFYFPFYSLLSLPLKMLFQLLGANQIRAFTVMNALFIITALIYTYKKLNVSVMYKLLAVLLFIISPIYVYIEYISAEAMMFSFIAIGLVMYSNKQYKSAAFMIAAASMPNPTVMGIGIVMVSEYLIKMFINRKRVRIFSKDNILSVIKYGCCYLPCLIPFIFNFFVIGAGNPTSGGATLHDYIPRVLTYFFDVNIGFFSFAPLTLCTFFVLTALSLKKRQYESIVYAGFLLAPVLAYSLMIYINCIPVFCSRYIMWTYPALFIGTVLMADKLICGDFAKYIFSGVLTAAAGAMIIINNIPMYYFGFNGMSKFLLEYFPAVYNPYRGTFYADNDRLNWPYDIDWPSYYFSEKDGSLRKLLFRSTDEYKKEVINSLKGSGDSLEKFTEKLDKIPSDGKFHYVNISPLSNVKLRKKTSEDNGIFRENGKVLEKSVPFTVEGENTNFEIELEPNTYYKIDIRFDEKSVPSFNESFCIYINSICYGLKSFTCTDENTYSNIFWEGEESDLISLFSNDKLIVDSFCITSMENTKTVTVSDGAVNFSGGSANDNILYPVQLEPFKNYLVSVNISNKDKLSEEDEIYCQFYYEKRFNHIPADYCITEGENKFMMYSGDTTIGIGPTYIKIYGKSENEIEIESVTVEYAQ